MNPNSLRAQLIRDEGLRLRAYRDPCGKTTIGVGRNLDDRGVTEDEAMFLLANDINEVVSEVSAAFPWTSNLNDARFAVLANMAFNMGLGGLLLFDRMLDALRNGDFETAACEMVQSRWACQVGARATRLAEQMRTGVWQ